MAYEKQEKSSSKGIIIVLIIIVVILGYMLIRQNAKYSNSGTGVNYRDAVYKSYGDCMEPIYGTIEYYGDDQGYYCYQTKDTYGNTVWKTGNVYKD